MPGSRGIISPLVQKHPTVYFNLRFVSIVKPRRIQRPGIKSNCIIIFNGVATAIARFQLILFDYLLMRCSEEGRRFRTFI